MKPTESVSVPSSIPRRPRPFPVRLAIGLWLTLKPGANFLMITKIISVILLIVLAFGGWVELHFWAFRTLEWAKTKDDFLALSFFSFVVEVILLLIGHSTIQKIRSNMPEV